MTRKPRILLYDIETSPNLGYTWKKWETNVIEFKEEWQVLSVAWKWYGEKEVFCMTRKGRRSDKAIVKHIHKLFSSADITVAHNGDEFDKKKVHARMVFHKLKPPRPVVSVDTKKVAKAYFEFNGNALNELGVHLGLGKKYKHSGFQMWLDCMADKPSAWREMAFYNKKDVVLLERVYKRFKPWIMNHPNVARLVEPHVGKFYRCPSCGGTKTIKKGVHATADQIRQKWHCLRKGCGRWYITRLVKPQIKRGLP